MHQHDREVVGNFHSKSPPTRLSQKGIINLES